ncbi:MAG TPA: BON domain-containing protein [Candidatus Sulfotelmatobacter sp.]|nr:BON domain-containing protein [Candidatus Sulfotelmatobacter sp.]
MRKVARSVGTAVVALLLLGACQSMTGETAGQNVDDTSITTAVKAKLASDRAITLTRVDVQTNQGVVSLDGVATDPAMKARAGQIAASVNGVRGVNNNLQVQAQRPPQQGS